MEKRKVSTGRKKKIEKWFAFEKGMIEAWRHIRHVCNGCIKAHKEEIKRIRKEDKWK